jgi:hypothetical protein
LFPVDSPVVRLNTEQIGKNLEKQQPDEIVAIEGKIYVIEEQTGPDKNMAIRVFEYGYAQALKDKAMSLPAAAAGYLVSFTLSTRLVLQGNYLTVGFTTILSLALPNRTAASGGVLNPTANKRRHDSIAVSAHDCDILGSWEHNARRS